MDNTEIDKGDHSRNRTIDAAELTPASIHDSPPGERQYEPPKTAKAGLREKLNVFSDLSEAGGDDDAGRLTNKEMKIQQNNYTNIMSADRCDNEN